ncbi:hypothetical protein SEUCBS139899_010595 [Sporothrix eucalyptigena]
MIIGGVSADQATARFLRRNGFHKPESMLPVIFPVAVTTPVSIALLGVSLQRGWHWAVIGVLWAILNINLTAGCTILMSYSTDVNREKAIDVGVVINVTKSAIAAGISFATVDWWILDQYLMFVVLAVIEVLIFLLVVPLYFSLYFWGPKLSQISKSYVEGYNVTG